MDVKSTDDYTIENEKLGDLGIYQNTASQIMAAIELARYGDRTGWNAIILSLNTVINLSEDDLLFISDTTGLKIIWDNLMAQTIFKLAVATELESQADMWNPFTSQTNTEGEIS